LILSAGQPVVKSSMRRSFGNAELPTLVTSSASRRCLLVAAHRATLRGPVLWREASVLLPLYPLACTPEKSNDNFLVKYCCALASEHCLEIGKKRVGSTSNGE
jgi:hypothetical protein